MLEAIDLYNENHSKLILITKTLNPPGFSKLAKLGAGYPEDYKIKLHIASRLGVKKNNIRLLEKKVANTYDEAVAAYEFMEKNKLISLTVVSSKIHTKRASMIFKDIMKERFKVYIKPSRHDPYNPDKPEIVRRYSKEILYEYQKILFYKLIKIFSTSYPQFR